jgi:hypothetical protein
MNSDGGELEIRPGVSSTDSLMRIGAARRTWISDLSPNQQASINRFPSTREPSAQHCTELARPLMAHISLRRSTPHTRAGRLER